MGLLKKKKRGYTIGQPSEETIKKSAEGIVPFIINGKA